MTVAALTPSADYIEDGLTTGFPLPFRFLDPANIKASRELADGSSIELVYGVDYSVTGGASDAGGTLTVVTPAAAGVKLHLWRETARSQTTDYTTGDRFPAESHEAALDKARLIDQEQDVVLGRTLTVPVGEVGLVLPGIAARKGALLAFNAVTGEAEPGFDIAATGTVAEAVEAVKLVATSIVGVNTVAASIGSVNTVSASIGSVNAVADYMASVILVGGSIANVNTVAGSIGSVIAVGSNIAAVVTAAANIGAIVAAPTYAGIAAAAVEGIAYLGKSARFPANNRAGGAGSPFACIAQPTANMGTWLATDGTLYVEVTIPRERLRASATGQSNISRALLGNVLTGTAAHNFTLNITGASGVFQTQLTFFARSNSSLNIPTQTFLIPESCGCRLAIAMRRTGGTFAMDVWDCDTGTKYAGPTLDITTFTGLNPAGLGGFFQIGSGGNTNVAPTAPGFGDLQARCWEGDIGLIGYYTAALSDAVLQSMALGASAETVTTPANWKWVRELTGTLPSLTKPAWATGDTTSPAQAISAGGLEVERGSSVSGKNTTITLDRKIAGDAHVDAVLPGQTTKSVVVSGKVRAGLAATDAVEVRFLTTDGRAVTQWRRVATVNPGDTAWTGTIPVPKGIDRYIRQARLASNAGDPTRWFLDATRFAVGYRALILGQSQMANLRSTNRGLVYKGGHPFSYIEQALEAAPDISAINAFALNDRMPAIGDGIFGILSAIEAAGCDAPVAIEIQAVGGTSAIDLIKDGLGSRTWSPILRSKEMMDGGVSTVLWCWDPADILVNYGDLLDAVFGGTGPQAGDHLIFGAASDGGSPVGATVVYMPTQRTNGNNTTEADSDTSVVYGTRRDEGVAWATAKPFAVVGIAPLNLELSDSLHPSLTLASGTEAHGRHVGLSLLRGFGQDTSRNPTVIPGSFAFTDGSRTAFKFRVNLPNFGVLRNGLGATSTSGADKAVRLIEVSANAGASYTKSGFTAVISGRDEVTVTKSSGSWPAGLLAHVGWGGFGSYGLPTSGITSGNIAARDYWMFDGYARHINGLGIPVLPSNAAYAVSG